MQIRDITVSKNTMRVTCPSSAGIHLFSNNHKIADTFCSDMGVDYRAITVTFTFTSNSQSNKSLSGLPFINQYLVLMTLKKVPFKNIMGRGKNAGKQHFLFSQQYFRPFHPFPNNKF